MAEIDFDAVIAKFIQLRNERSDLKRTFELNDEVLKSQQTKIQQWILAKQRQMNVTQLKSESGIAFQVPRKIFTCQDWSVAHAWIRDNDRLDLLEKRLGQRALAEMLEETGSIPPGMGMITETEISIRKG